MTDNRLPKNNFAAASPAALAFELLCLCIIVYYRTFQHSKDQITYAHLRANIQSNVSPLSFSVLNLWPGSRQVWPTQPTRESEWRSCTRKVSHMLCQFNSLDSKQTLGLIELSYSCGLFVECVWSYLFMFCCSWGFNEVPGPSVHWPHHCTWQHEVGVHPGWWVSDDK